MIARNNTLVVKFKNYLIGTLSFLNQKKQSAQIEFFTYLVHFESKR